MTQLDEILQVQKEILALMATQNTTIAQLVSDFNSFQNDCNTFFTNQTNFNTKLSAFFTALQSGANGTVLSPADQSSINQLDSEISPLDTQAKTLNTTVTGFTIPNA